MGIKIIYSPIANNDLREIFLFIKRDSLFYAKREVALIRDTIKKLKLNLFIGRKFEGSDNELIREFIYRNYLIVYEISEDHNKIDIHTIHHHSRSFSNNPAFNTDDE